MTTHNLLKKQIVLFLVFMASAILGVSRPDLASSSPSFDIRSAPLEASLNVLYQQGLTILSTPAHTLHHRSPASPNEPPPTDAEHLAYASSKADLIINNYLVPEIQAILSSGSPNKPQAIDAAYEKWRMTYARLATAHMSRGVGLRWNPVQFAGSSTRGEIKDPSGFLKEFETKLQDRIKALNSQMKSNGGKEIPLSPSAMDPAKRLKPARDTRKNLPLVDGVKLDDVLMDGLRHRL